MTLTSAVDTHFRPVRPEVGAQQLYRRNSLRSALTWTESSPPIGGNAALTPLV